MAMFKKDKTAIILEQKISRDFGLDLLKAFHESNKKSSSYKITFDQLVTMLESRTNQKRFINILGGSVLNSGTSKAQAIKAMETLGNNSHGRIPSRNADFISAIIQKATQFSYVDAAVFTVTESAKDIVHGAQVVGDTLINTGKILQLLFPIAVVYFGYMFLKKKVA